MLVQTVKVAPKLLGTVNNCKTLCEHMQHSKPCTPFRVNNSCNVRFKPSEVGKKRCERVPDRFGMMQTTTRCSKHLKPFTNPQKPSCTQACKKALPILHSTSLISQRHRRQRFNFQYFIVLHWFPAKNPVRRGRPGLRGRRRAPPDRRWRRDRPQPRVDSPASME